MYLREQIQRLISYTHTNQSHEQSLYIPIHTFEEYVHTVAVCSYEYLQSCT